MIGVAFGWILHVNRMASRPPVEDAGREKVDEVLHRLYDLTGSLGHNVDRHANQVQSIGDELAQAQGKSDSEIQEALFTAMAQIAEANARLKGELNSAEKKLQEQAGEIESQMAAARTDALTGISNRRAFDDRLGTYIAEFQRTKTPVSLILLDVDHFKKFNDTHGHLAGDKVLQGVALAMDGATRGEDTVARYGGEEFAVLVPDIDAQATAEAVRRAIEARPFPFEGATLQVTASGGMAQLLPGDDAATLIRRADEALYASKKAGRNRTHWHDGERCIPLTPTSVAAATPTIATPTAKPEEKVVEKAAARPSSPPARPVRARTAPEPVADTRTGSPEHCGLVEEIKRCLAESCETDSTLSLVLVNVDNLKRLNDLHGIATGDVVLRAVMQFLTAGLREIDVITRFGGDSFALILPKADLSHAGQVAERVRNAIGLCKLRVGDSEIHFTISSGLVEAELGDDADVLLLRSSMALQAAKEAGRNRTFYHDGARCQPITEVGQDVQPAMAMA